MHDADLAPVLPTVLARNVGQDWHKAVTFRHRLASTSSIIWRLPRPYYRATESFSLPGGFAPSIGLSWMWKNHGLARFALEQKTKRQIGGRAACIHNSALPERRMTCTALSKRSAVRIACRKHGN